MRLNNNQEIQLWGSVYAAAIANNWSTGAGGEAADKAVEELRKRMPPGTCALIVPVEEEGNKTTTGYHFVKPAVKKDA